MNPFEQQPYQNQGSTDMTAHWAIFPKTNAQCTVYYFLFGVDPRWPPRNINCRCVMEWVVRDEYCEGENNEY